LEKELSKILFIASEPIDKERMRSGAELQCVRDQLERNPSFRIEAIQSTKTDDLLQKILAYEPNLLHFCVPGEETGEMYLEDTRGESKTVLPDALANVFRLASKHVKCVFLNTTFSDKQIQAISQFVPIVIAARQRMNSDTAIKFAKFFYQQLDPNLSTQNLRRALDCGEASIMLENQPSDLILIDRTPETMFAKEIDDALNRVSDIKSKEFTSTKGLLELKGKGWRLTEDVVLRIIEERVSNREMYQTGLAIYASEMKSMFRDTENSPVSDVGKITLLQYQKYYSLRESDVQDIRDRVAFEFNYLTDAFCYDSGQCLSKEDPAKAIRHFTRAIKLNARHSGAYFMRGTCHNLLKQFKSALEDFSVAIKVDNDWADANLAGAYFSRAEVFHKISALDDVARAKNLQLSISDWDKTISLDPSRAEAYCGRGAAYQACGCYYDAIIDFIRYYEMIQEEHSKKDAAIRIANCYLKVGEHGKFNEWLSRVEPLKSLPGPKRTRRADEEKHQLAETNIFESSSATIPSRYGQPAISQPLQMTDTASMRPTLSGK
jgi:tetratricopeptide (TPR) repeat protein